jgi:hypothetical protein
MSQVDRIRRRRKKERLELKQLSEVRASSLAEIRRRSALHVAGREDQKKVLEHQEICRDSG